VRKAAHYTLEWLRGARTINKRRAL